MSKQMSDRKTDTRKSLLDSHEDVSVLVSVDSSIVSLTLYTQKVRPFELESRIFSADYFCVIHEIFIVLVNLGASEFARPPGN